MSKKTKFSKVKRFCNTLLIDDLIAINEKEKGFEEKRN